MNNLFQMQLCRLCLLEKNSYSSIYEANECYGFLIADAINELLELDVSPGDGLPDNVCRDCLEEVARFKRFKNVCHEAKYTYKYLNVQHNAILMNIKVEPKEDDLFEAVENEINSLQHIKSEPLEEEECQAKVVNVYSNRFKHATLDYLDFCSSKYSSSQSRLEQSAVDSTKDKHERHLAQVFAAYSIPQLTEIWRAANHEYPKLQMKNLQMITPAEYERHGSNYILSDQRSNYVARKLNSTDVGDDVKYLLQHQALREGGEVVSLPRDFNGTNRNDVGASYIIPIGSIKVTW